MTTERAVLLIDLQEQFFDPPELREVRSEVVASVRRLLDRARAAGVPVVNVRTVHRPDRSTWALNMLEDDQPLVIAGTPGAAPLAELDLTDTEEVLKTRDDAFFETGLIELLRKLGVEELLIAGVSTDACISLTASTAYAYDLRVQLVTDAMASADPAEHRHTLELLHEQYRQPLVDSSTACL